MIHEIHIKAVLNGYICNVGCQIVVFTRREDLIAELDGYLQRPDTYRDNYEKHALNKDLLKCPAPVNPQCEPRGFVVRDTPAACEPVTCANR
jgi:hypothetical protein